jgi:antitoxin component YwqK of YwqJK toxin-antitoxin module
MKSIISLFITIFLSFYANGQTFVDVSKTTKVTKEGVEITTFEGKPFTGYLTETYPNGKPKTWKTLKDGIANGLWQEWLENGKLKYNAYWKDGKGHGLWQYFHDNGILKYEESYIMDIPNGISRTYHINGQLKDDNFWLNGKKQGVWSSYSETGILLKTEMYEDNKLIPTTKK